MAKGKTTIVVSQTFEVQYLIDPRRMNITKEQLVEGLKNKTLKIDKKHGSMGKGGLWIDDWRDVVNESGEAVACLRHDNGPAVLRSEKTTVVIEGKAPSK